MASENITHSRQHDDAIPFFPDHFLTEYWVAFGVMALTFVIGVIGQLMPVGIGEPADPFNTPLHVKPEWYFLGLYQMLKFVPKTLGVLIPIIGVAFLFIWPFIDRKQEKSPARGRRIRFIAVAIFILAYAALTIWGELS